jgi:RsmE family RNA methyltransferase
MHRFLSHEPLAKNFSIYEWTRFHQISRVFRAKKWDKFVFFEPQCDDRLYEVVALSKKQIDFTEREKSYISNKKKKLNITIFQAFPNKIATIEILVQKLVEIGINKVVFFRSDRSQLHEMPAGKSSRVVAIAEEALEQSGGNHPMSIIYKKDSLEEVFENDDKHTQHIVGYPKVKNALTLDKNCENYTLWIWPEGGWSEKEEAFFRGKSATLWTFNSNVLRLETASIVGAGILAYLLE